MSNKLKKPKKHGHFAHLRVNKDGFLEMFCERDRVGYLMAEVFASYATGKSQRHRPSKIPADGQASKALYFQIFAKMLETVEKMNNRESECYTESG